MNIKIDKKVGLWVTMFPKLIMGKYRYELGAHPKEITQR